MITVIHALMHKFGNYPFESFNLNANAYFAYQKSTADGYIYIYILQDRKFICLGILQGDLPLHVNNRKPIQLLSCAC